MSRPPPDRDPDLLFYKNTVTSLCAALHASVDIYETGGAHNLDIDRRLYEAETHLLRAVDLFQLLKLGREP